MTELHTQKCEACRTGAPTVSEQEAASLMGQVPDWEIIEEQQIKKLTRTFKFRNFQKALDFTNSVGRIAEQEGHHPVIITEWGSVTVIWWSHKIKGLHVNDFIMAAGTDRQFHEEST